MAVCSERVQPCLDALARAAFPDHGVRDWAVRGTRAEDAFSGSRSLHAEQARLRPGTKQPFHGNYWCGKGSRCPCRLPGSRGLETDLLLFLEAADGRRLGVRVEFEHPIEAVSFGQAESYALRAACSANPETRPARVVGRDDRLRAVVCGDSRRDGPDLAPFRRRIGHGEARRPIAGRPA